ncbi:MAG: uroporphyrinogen-III synthase [Metallosphaera sp.]|uniref:uroporphyrinogen-III synthase n=1 Tax=Metallosphaera sp. TaxID=2020860 RepID=UPI00316220AA
MRVLYLRPEGSEVPQLDNVDVLNVPLFSPKCIDYSFKSETEAVGFTSVNSVRCFKDFDKISDLKVFSIGPVTAEELLKHGIRSEYPSKYTSKDLARLVLERRVRHFTSFRSAKASSEMKGILNLISYQEIFNYDLVLNEAKVQDAKKILEECSVQMVVLTSSLIAKTVANFLRDCYKVISIGPMTSATLRSVKPELSFIESDISTIEGTIQEIEKFLRR